MKNEYRISRTSSDGPRITASDPDVIVKSLAIYGYGDTISFFKQNADKSRFGSHWDIHALGCFVEFRGKRCSRLVSMDPHQIKDLAGRIFELLYMKHHGDERYGMKPVIDETKPRYRQILGELTYLQQRAKEVLASEDGLPEMGPGELEHLCESMM